MPDTLIVVEDTNTIVFEEDNTVIALTPIGVETVVIENNSTILVPSNDNDISNIISSEIYTIIVESDNPTIIIEGQPGPPGMSEDLMVYAKQYDFVGNNLIYKGEAVVGSSLTSPVWRIKRTTIANDNDISDQWADGNADFDNVWSDRLILSYS